MSEHLIDDQTKQVIHDIYLRCAQIARDSGQTGWIFSRQSPEKIAEHIAELILAEGAYHGIKETLPYKINKKPQVIVNNKW